MIIERKRFNDGYVVEGGTTTCQIVCYFPASGARCKYLFLCTSKARKVSTNCLLLPLSNTLSAHLSQDLWRSSDDQARPRRSYAPPVSSLDIVKLDILVPSYISISRSMKILGWSSKASTISWTLVSWSDISEPKVRYFSIKLYFQHAALRYILHIPPTPLHTTWFDNPNQDLPQGTQQWSRAT